jgi:hypothetical protein
MNVALTSSVRVMNATTATSLLVRPTGSPMGEAIYHTFQAAGFRVLVVPSVYDAVVEAARAKGPIRHVIVGVDCFGQQEFRLFPLVRREWPAATLVAYHSAGFEHKGRLAEMIGADVVLGTPEAVARYAEDLTLPAAESPVPLAPLSTLEVEEPEPAEAEPSPVVAEVAPQPPAPVAPPARSFETSTSAPKRPVEVPAPVAAVEPKITPAPVVAAAPAPASSMPQSVAVAVSATASSATLNTIPPVVAAMKPPVSAPAKPAKPAAAPPSEEEAWEDGEVIGTIELTEEEMRLLFGEEEA